MTWEILLQVQKGSVPDQAMQKPTTLEHADVSK